MTAGAAGPKAFTPNAAVPAQPPGWSLLFAWAGALLFVVSLSYFVYAYMVRFGRTVAGEDHARSVLVNTALFTVFALHHSIFARKRAKAWVRRVMHPALERSIYTWLASILLICVCARWEFVPGDVYRLRDAWSVVAYAAQVCGVFFAFRGSKVLDVLDLAGVRPILNARAGREPAHVPLMTSGVFGLVRHPIYFGWALFVFGSPHMTATRFVFAVISTAYLAMAIPWEERGLVNEFGTRYEEYRQRVRWRMVPGLY